MITHIKTSRDNKSIVSKLSRKLNFGSENIIARIAFTYSLSKSRLLDLSQVKDSQGKEYSRHVLFGNNYDFYISLICVHYNIYKTDKDIPKYVKLHLDDGLEMINNEIAENPNLDSFDYIIEKIDDGLKSINNFANVK